MKNNQIILCPCNSNSLYLSCCGLYITGVQNPLTAEALMRSRYTAYTQANIAYIQATMREKSAENFDPIAAEKWAKSVRWKRLKIIRTFSGTIDNTAYVEFIAYYSFKGRLEKLLETSEFKRLDNQWYYVGPLI